MAFIKFCNAQTKIRVVEPMDIPKFSKKVAANMVNINTDDYIYLVNESVHCMEHYGANANGDAFPLFEMKKNYHTFINRRVSVDHRDDQIVGEVEDSVFIEPTMSGKSVVSGKHEFVGGGYIENILAVNKKMANEIKPGLVDRLLNGDITDTSMGAIVAYTECSVPTCRHIAYNQDDYCEHIKGGKNREIVLASGEPCKVYEVCHGVTWFEDSIIVPLHFGGLAGGEGADPDAKVLHLITEATKYENTLTKLVDTVRKYGSKNEQDILEMILDFMVKIGE